MIGYIPKADQHRFIVGVREEKESLDMINVPLSLANNRPYGRLIVPCLFMRYCELPLMDT